MIGHRLELGTKIYYVEDNHVFSRKKIYMTDENGVEWYRYDTPLRTQRLIEYEVVGRVLRDIEGQVSDPEDLTDVYYLNDGPTVIPADINESDHWSGYFLDKEEALAWIESRREEAQRIERS